MFSPIDFGNLVENGQNKNDGPCNMQKSMRLALISRTDKYQSKTSDSISNITARTPVAICSNIYNKCKSE